MEKGLYHYHVYAHLTKPSGIPYLEYDGIFTRDVPLLASEYSSTKEWIRQQCFPSNAEGHLSIRSLTLVHDPRLEEE